MKHLGFAGKAHELLEDAHLLYLNIRGWLLLGAIGIAAVMAITTLKACTDYDNVALELSNEKAAHDVTRVVALTEKQRRKILGDSVHALERLIVQRAPKKDELDKATHRTSVVKGELTIGITPVDTSVTAPVKLVDNDVRTAEFHLRKAPFTVNAVTTLPPYPGTATIDLAITTDTTHIDFRVQCGKKEHGVRSATAMIVPPAWLPAELGRLEADPKVCNNDTRGIRKWLHAGIGVGRGVMISNGGVREGWTLTAAVFVGR